MSQIKVVLRDPKKRVIEPINKKVLKVGEPISVPRNEYWIKRINEKDVELYSDAPMKNEKNNKKEGK